MSKNKSTFVCSNCGFDSPKWLGKCPSCGEWNTIVEIHVKSVDASEWSANLPKPKVSMIVPDDDRYAHDEKRILVPGVELNRVLGGGIVPGSLILLGGEPGIGKSTLMLQIALQIQGVKVLYISGEESEQQIRMRAKRVIGEKNAEAPMECFLLTETLVDDIFAELNVLKPSVVIIDSIQTMASKNSEGAPGSVSQVRGCTAEIMKYAKSSGIAFFLIGHITKEGSIAGPKILEHMVDCVLQFEGDRHYTYRIIRALKNRYGATSELGMYEMEGSGLREVPNPSEIFLSQREELLSGITVSVIAEGSRMLLIESQALVSSSIYGTPQRSSTGYDSRRMNMLLAVLEKKYGFQLITRDVFLNITGGIRVEDPSIDLGLIVAIISSFKDLPVNYATCFCAEVGLSGELRSVNRIDQRISEARKLGFTDIYISKFNKQVPGGRMEGVKGILVHALSSVEEVVKMIFK